MKRHMKILVAVIMLLTFFGIPSVAAEEFELIAGQNDVVGTISVSNDEHNLYVTYMINDPDEWRITSTHLDVELDPKYFPTTKTGNPKVGNFEYNDPHDYVSEYTYQIPITGCGVKYIAAHADVAQITSVDSMQMLEILEENLPQCVTFSTVQQPTPYSYFLTRIYPESSLADDYAGWCAQTNVYIGRDTHTAMVYSSYDPQLYSIEWPEDYSLTKFTPENFAYVNWIINQHYVGSDAGLGKFTYGDVQMAIWSFIADEYPPVTYPFNAYNADRVQYIIDAAGTNGAGFVPDPADPEQNIVLVLVPVDNCQDQNVQIVQLSIIEASASGLMELTDEFTLTGREETAWGAGTIDEVFPGGSWATYFTYDVLC